jgi:hypothetical protein
MDYFVEELVFLEIGAKIEISSEENRSIIL